MISVTLLDVQWGAVIRGLKHRHDVLITERDRMMDKVSAIGGQDGHTVQAIEVVNTEIDLLEGARTIIWKAYAAHTIQRITEGPNEEVHGEGHALSPPDKKK